MPQVAGRVRVLQKVYGKFSDIPLMTPMLCGTCGSERTNPSAIRQFDVISHLVSVATVYLTKRLPGG